MQDDQDKVLVTEDTPEKVKGAEAGDFHAFRSSGRC